MIYDLRGRSATMNSSRKIFRGAQRCQKCLETFSLNTRHVMTFLDPLIVLIFGMPFSLVLKFGVQVPSGALSVWV